MHNLNLTVGRYGSPCPGGSRPSRQLGPLAMPIAIESSRLVVSSSVVDVRQPGKVHNRAACAHQQQGHTLRLEVQATQQQERSLDEWSTEAGDTTADRMAGTTHATSGQRVDGNGHHAESASTPKDAGASSKDAASSSNGSSSSRSATRATRNANGAGSSLLRPQRAADERPRPSPSSNSGAAAAAALGAVQHGADTAAETTSGSTSGSTVLRPAVTSTWSSEYDREGDDDAEWSMGREGDEDWEAPRVVRRPPPVPMRLVPVGDLRLLSPDGSPLPEPDGIADATTSGASSTPQVASTAGSVRQTVSGALSDAGCSVRLPLVGPWVLSNSPKAFVATDATVQYATQHNDRLAVRLEYITDRGEPGARPQLQLFNISRVVRGRSREAAVYVNGQPVQPGSQGVPLFPGDVVALGGAQGVAMRVEAADAPPSHVEEALQRYCQGVTGGDQASSQSLASSNGSAIRGRSRKGEQPQQAPAQAGMPMPMPWWQLNRLAREDPQGADRGFRELAAKEPHNSAVWHAWAQLATGMRRPKLARDLFRAAAEAAAAAGSSASTEATSSLSPAAVGDAVDAELSGQPGRVRGAPTTPPPTPASSSQGATSSEDGEEEQVAGRSGSAAAATPRSADGSWNKPLMQVLFNWARFEWGLRLYGPARHLFRRAADLALAHPDGWAAGGAGIILHAWASAELQNENVRNARIVAAEALRKCPADQPLYVLAGNIELAGGNLDLAKAFCMRAYELDRRDKQLYLVWPRIEAAAGEPDRARVLYERGLEYHPSNTKIMNQYAQFEAEQGDVDAARELHERALSVDSTSVTSLYNRTSWASLEAEEGNLEQARTLLEEGLSLHPTGPASVGALVVLAKVERLEGNLEAARSLLDRAAKSTTQFNQAIIKERSLLMRLAGERTLARNLDAHLRSVRRLEEAKRGGAWGWQALSAYYEEVRAPERRALTQRAHARKRELGLWGEAPGTPGPVPRGERSAAPLVPAAGAREPKPWVPPPGLLAALEAEEEAAAQREGDEGEAQQQ